MPEITTPDIPLLRGPVPLSHLLLQRFVHPGDRVVDATCGNGHDTLLLAGLAGPCGRVWAFDIQPEALDATAARLAEADIIEFANKRGSGQVMYAGYFPMGLSLDRIFSEMPDVPFRDEVWPKFLRENAVKVFKLDV